MVRGIDRARIDVCDSLSFTTYKSRPTCVTGESPDLPVPRARPPDVHVQRPNPVTKHVRPEPGGKISVHILEMERKMFLFRAEVVNKD